MNSPASFGQNTGNMGNMNMGNMGNMGSYYQNPNMNSPVSFGQNTGNMGNMNMGNMNMGNMNMGNMGGFSSSRPNGNRLFAPMVASSNPANKEQGKTES